MKICPKCGNIVFYNSYFGAYICNSCDWEEKIRDRQVQNKGLKDIQKHVFLVKRKFQDKKVKA